MTPEDLDEAWQVLNDNQKTVLTRRFGLNGEKPATLEAIGISLGVSKERIRQHESVALSMLRRAGRQLEEFGKITLQPTQIRTKPAPVAKPKPKKRRRRSVYVPPQKPPLIRHTDAERIEWMEFAIKYQNLYIDWSGSRAWTLKLKDLRVEEKSLRDLLDRAMMEPRTLVI